MTETAKEIEAANPAPAPKVVGTPIFSITPTLAVVLSLVGVGLAALNTMAGLPVWAYTVLSFVLPLGNLIGIWSAGPRWQPKSDAAEVPAPKPSV